MTAGQPLVNRLSTAMPPQQSSQTHSITTITLTVLIKHPRFTSQFSLAYFTSLCNVHEVHTMPKLTKNEPKYHTTLRLRKPKSKRPPSRYTAYKPSSQSVLDNAKEHDMAPRTQHTHTNECVYWGCQHRGNEEMVRPKKRSLSDYGRHGTALGDVPLVLAPGYRSKESHTSSTGGRNEAEYMLDGCEDTKAWRKHEGSTCCILQ